MPSLSKQKALKRYQRLLTAEKLLLKLELQNISSTVRGLEKELQGLSERFHSENKLLRQESWLYCLSSFLLEESFSAQTISEKELLKIKAQQVECEQKLSTLYKKRKGLEAHQTKLKKAKKQASRNKEQRDLDEYSSLNHRGRSLKKSD